MLGALGLDAIEEATYRHLVSRPSADRSGIATALGEPEGAISQALDTLQARGLASASAGEQGHYAAAPPSVALGSMLLSRQRELAQVEQELHTLMADYRASVAQRTVTEVIDVVVGRDAVAQRFAELQRAARDEVLAFVQSSVLVVSAEENVEEESALSRGVSYRVVLEQRLLDQPGFYEQLAPAAAAGEQHRMTPALPLRMLVVDREFALLPLSPTEGPVGAMLVHRSSLLDALLALFDLVWHQAEPVTPTGGAAGELETTDAQVLGLLMLGQTDQSVANTLGLSLRSVQRRVRAMMDAAGVDTRIQLGREAQRRGWLA